ncbi:LysE family translocator [Vineibacter terrae]|uniref:LysE family translocator n=1 Tax=Vineibacter terrae TaxID=2586908 RepID=UPI002E34B762|nr:LysE family translocator [Vineibacter terrae]HEX2891005.1 LysE family translocator [Vineibacter terrae]
MSLELYVAYLVACVVITVVPGPTVTLIVANSLTHGMRAGLLNVAGTQLGIAMMMVVLVVGLASIVETMGFWFDWVRLLGAAYLVWLGWKMLRTSGAIDAGGAAPKPRGGFFLQGFLVMLSNPKTLIFFGAFIPQFVNPNGDYVGQVVLLCATAMAVAMVTDSLYAILTSRARMLFSSRRVRLMSQVSGATLIGGGVWLALSRSR